ncbi:site-specific integrase [Paracoccus sp. IB05]|uniref:tyrosine-type recombinase/integrase n=1 Tax=Paracoccus sp. IB05 TaxID=2779367 RepID=UPI0018E7A7A3|nr:site-specific integrase [Paracoccus sp. IB05]MBJ2153782.1 site-specific integrase [Paracoccus sp. IB05]
MTTTTVKLGIWNRKRRLASGKVQCQRLHSVNWMCPETGKKRRLSFATKPEAEAERDRIVAAMKGQRYFNPNANPTVAEAVTHWLGVKTPDIKPQTRKTYAILTRIITGPLLQGSPKERAVFTETGVKPHRDAKILQMLGPKKLSELTTAEIRAWHATVREEVGEFSAKEVKGMLKSILALAQEDFGVPVPNMPSNLTRRKQKPKKSILDPGEVAQLIDHAKSDPARGIFYAFPFLTGVRASEQLGLLWEDVDFDAGVIRIRRVQERDGSMTLATKTEAGEREIPICASLRKMLLEWKLICPRLDGRLYRVFCGPGHPRAWPQRPEGSGAAILYSNFLRRYWQPGLKAAGVRYVTHHSARHSFVSTLQAQGVEVGLVAKLAGHANPAVTLGHYTQAVRGGEGALRLLDEAYGAVAGGLR